MKKSSKHVGEEPSALSSMLATFLHSVSLNIKNKFTQLSDSDTRTHMNYYFFGYFIMYPPFVRPSSNLHLTVMTIKGFLVMDNSTVTKHHTFYMYYDVALHGMVARGERSLRAGTSSNRNSPVSSDTFYMYDDVALHGMVARGERSLRAGTSSNRDSPVF